MIVGIVLLFRLMTTEAVRCLRVCAEMRFDLRYRVTDSAFFVSRERGFLAASIYFMADVAIGPAPYDLRHLPFYVKVKLVRKVEQNRARLFIIRELAHPRHLILRNVRVANGTEFFLGKFRRKPLLVARITRIVSGSGERRFSFSRRLMTARAVQARFQVLIVT